MTTPTNPKPPVTDPRFSAPLSAQDAETLHRFAEDIGAGGCMPAWMRDKIDAARTPPASQTATPTPKALGNNDDSLFAPSEMNPMPTALSQAVITGLEYIANSPPPKYGGFHPETIQTAQAALKLIGWQSARLAAITEENRLLSEGHFLLQNRVMHAAGPQEAKSACAQMMQEQLFAQLQGTIDALRSDNQRLARERDELKRQLGETGWCP